MEFVEMTVVTSGNKFYGIVDRDHFEVSMRAGVVTFTDEADLDGFLAFNSAEETELNAENFNFFNI